MTIVTEFENALRVLPDAEELLRRYTVLLSVDKEFESEMVVLTKNFNGHGSDLYFWENGGGEEAYVIFRADGVHKDSVLAFVFAHESDFNFGGETEQQTIFVGLPENFKHLFAESALNKYGTAEPVATSAAWLVSGDPVWKFSSVFAEQVAHSESRIDANSFIEILDMFSFDPTVETLVDLFYEYFYFERSRDELTVLIEGYVNVEENGSKPRVLDAFTEYEL